MKKYFLVIAMSIIYFTLSAEDNLPNLGEVIKIFVTYDEKTDPNFLVIKIKNLANQDFEFKTVPAFMPYYLSIYSSKPNVFFPSESSSADKSKEKKDDPIRKILKNSEEIYKFDLKEVFKNKIYVYGDGLYIVEASITYYSEIDKKNHSISSDEVKLNLKCKFEEVKEKLKISLKFPNNLVIVDKNKVNCKIELQNLTNEPLTILDEFAFTRTLEVRFIKDSYDGGNYKLGGIQKWWETPADKPLHYITLKPNAKMNVKIELNEKEINFLDLPTGKFRAFARYSVLLGDNCLNGYFRSEEIIVEKK